MSYYDKSGAPISMDTWVVLSGDADYRRIGLTKVGESEVSTVWLGIDHSFGSGDPVIFETLVFEGPLDGDGMRYSTLAESEAGHAAMVERVKAGAS